MKRNVLLASCALAVSGVFFALMTVARPPFLHACFLKASFYIMLLLVFSFAAAVRHVLQEEKPAVRQFFAGHGAGLVLSFALAAVIFLSVKPYFRILDDEANLVAVSKSMAAERSVANVTQGKFYFYNLNEADWNEPKRPFLFPFLVFLLHVLIGYHAWNAFVLNFLILAGLFFLAYATLARHFGKAAGYAGIFALAAQPVIVQTATSAGFDLFAAFLILASIASLEFYYRKPGPARFELVWMTLLLLANARYEGALYLALAAGYLLFFGGLRREYFSASTFYGLTPWLLLPVFWQRFFVETDLQTPEGVKSFSAEHFLRHSADFLQSLFRFDFSLPYATIVNLAGVLALIAFSASYFSGKWPSDKKLRPFVPAAALLAGSYWAVINAHWSPFLSLPDGTRLMAFMAVALSAAAAAAAARLPYLRVRPVLLVGVFVLCFGFYHRVNLENRQQNLLNRSREYRIVLDYLKKQYPQTLLVVSNMPQLYPIQDYGAMNFDSANTNRDQILQDLRQGLYHHVFVVQEIDYATGQATAETALDGAFPLRPVFETQRETQHLLRISRVTV